jgi:hypothetical protein
VANSLISTPAPVQNSDGRKGVCLYDNAAVTDNTKKSAYVIYNDGTWRQEKRVNLTVLTGVPTFDIGEGPGN